MHILLCSSYPHLPETRGGLQSTTDELCLALLEKGVGVTVLSGTTADGAAPRHDRALGYQVIRSANPVAALPLVAAALQPSVVVVQSSAALAELLAVALETGIPTAVYLHNVESHRICGILPPHPDILYFANSVFTAERWRAWFGIDCAILPPLILPQRYEVPQTGDRVLFVNPVPEKGLERLIDLAIANPDIPFLVVDGWTAGEAWKNWLRPRFTSCPNIEWRPATDDMREVYAESRFLLMPSVWEEAYGRTATEAQLSGLPVLASRRGALPATVGAGGLLLDLDASPEDWRRAVRDLYFDILLWQELSEAAKTNARIAVLDALRALDDALVSLGLHFLRSEGVSTSAP